MTNLTKNPNICKFNSSLKNYFLVSHKDLLSPWFAIVCEQKTLKMFFACSMISVFEYVQYCAKQLARSSSSQDKSSSLRPHSNVPYCSRTFARPLVNARVIKRTFPRPFHFSSTFVFHILYIYIPAYT